MGSRHDTLGTVVQAVLDGGQGTLDTGEMIGDLGGVLLVELRER